MGSSQGTIYAEGESTDTTGLEVVAPKSVAAGSEYIWEYWCPAITFTVISPANLSSFIQGLLHIEDYLKQASPGTSAPPVKIVGVQIDTQTGRIWVRGIVQTVPVSDVEQAGVNPIAIAIMIGSLFAIIGAAVSLRYVYEVFVDPYEPAGGLDPCSNPGVVNYIKCLARESRWFLVGFMVGIIALTVFLLVRFGPKAGAE
jgi:hypothetical protein